MTKQTTAPKTKKPAAAPAAAAPTETPQPSARERLAAIKDDDGVFARANREILEREAWAERAANRGKNPLTGTAPADAPRTPDGLDIWQVLAKSPMATAEDASFLTPETAQFYALAVGDLYRRQPERLPPLSQVEAWSDLVAQLHRSGRERGNHLQGAAMWGGVRIAFGSDGRLTAAG